MDVIERLYSVPTFFVLIGGDVFSEQDFKVWLRYSVTVSCNAILWVCPHPIRQSTIGAYHAPSTPPLKTSTNIALRCCDIIITLDILFES
jgi:hypothetical protein